MDCDAIVIGSGFGGAVAACRLTQAGLAVRLLERGRRFRPGEFPRDLARRAGWLWGEDRGLFDVRPFGEMQIVQAAGYGGGSLIYANVALRPPADLFAMGWPSGYDRAALDPYFDLVAHALGVRPIPDGVAGGGLADGVAVPPDKTRRFADAADRLGRSAQLLRVPLAVDFGPPGIDHPNRFGRSQRGCTGCGECDLGCNEGAKNTLDLTYLALAEAAGLQVATEHEAFRIAPIDGGYAVDCHDHAQGGVDVRFTAERVFVCAGAVGSTELLLRCRDEHRTLPAIGDRLGYGYSGNGDFFALVYGARPPSEPWTGPTITSALLWDQGTGDDRRWFLLEDGGYGRMLARLFTLLDPRGGALGEIGTVLADELLSALGEKGRAALATQGDTPGTAVFLAMGRDRANGRLLLSPVGRRLDVRWDVAGNVPLYDAERRLASDIAEALGGTVALNPFWTRLHRPISVHNLGGCPMADDPVRGVVDGNGQLFAYPGLYVLDGAILPAATGVNPSHTIAAVAERCIEAVVRTRPDRASWRAPEWEQASASRPDDPFARIAVPRGGTLPSRTKPAGISFTETMKGFLSPATVAPANADGVTAHAGYIAAEQAGQRAGRKMSFTLSITIPELDLFLADREHAGIAQGSVHAAGLTGPEGAPVSQGLFNLFIAGDGFYDRRMLYLLPFEGEDGQRYLLDGFKDVRDDGHFDVWSASSTLYTVIRRGESRAAPVVACGIVRIHLLDFLHQVTTFRAPGTVSAAEAAAVLARFGSSFLGTLWDVFVRPRLP